MDISILLFGAAMHFADPEAGRPVTEYNNYNPGLGLRLGTTPALSQSGHTYRYTLTAARYYNSERSWSNVVGPGIEVGTSYGVSASVAYLDGYGAALSRSIVPMFGVWCKPVEQVALHAVLMEAGVGFYAEWKL